MPTPDAYQAAANDSSSAQFGFSLPGYRDGESYPTDLPMFVVRAGRDRFSEILGSIDHFTTFAFQQNLALTVRNYPEGHHTFDVDDDTEETRAIIKQTTRFLSSTFAWLTRPSWKAFASDSRWSGVGGRSA